MFFPLLFVMVPELGRESAHACVARAHVDTDVTFVAEHFTDTLHFNQ